MTTPSIQRNDRIAVNRKSLLVSTVARIGSILSKRMTGTTAIGNSGRKCQLAWIPLRGSDSYPSRATSAYQMQSHLQYPAR